ncbi:alginate export family protein [Ferruginibacter lapsinanis]|uniref:alginate export family protein n=1 Tax=Ferruginibacter lapsinanis TaxID=563172 RepID=UPI001E2E4E8F|nr:alginate export family protein [Ferruginibacter lapsinanis]UEG50110.1 alginate export family protein [Ferruginibacter lapsinanis]
MRKKTTFITTSFLIVMLGISSIVMAQFSLVGQVRTRTELRDGVGKLATKGGYVSSLTTQRTRLSFGYLYDNRVNFNVAIQDVRTWGQDASTITPADGAKLGLHEAWAEITLFNINDTTMKKGFLEKLFFKIGRQELLYDDARLLGNLDWAQQGRRHDALLLKALHRGYQIDLGAAFNQNSDAITTGTVYTPGNVPAYVLNDIGVLVPTPASFIPTAAGGSASNVSSAAGTPVLINPAGTNGMNQLYKSLQFLYLSKKFGQTKVSALMLTDYFAKYTSTSVAAGGGLVYGRKFTKGINQRFTYGAMAVGTIGNASGLKKTWTIAGYAQAGKNKDGKKLEAYHGVVNVMLQKGKFSFGPGYEYLSGTGPTAVKDGSFDPLYGTPHKFWGYMDYFYVGTGSPKAGLQDAYLKTKYATKNFFATLDAHYFGTAQKTSVGAGNKDLGWELDLLANYTLNKFTTLEFGYSNMFANKTQMKAAMAANYPNAATTYNSTGSWAYLMISIKPDFFFAKPVAIKQP